VVEFLVVHQFPPGLAARCSPLVLLVSHWFRPDPRVGARQRVCSKAECRALHRQKTQASWRRRNPGYAIAYRIDQRAQAESPPEALRVPAPLNQLPWEFA
jgi:hypothetical protein